MLASLSLPSIPFLFFFSSIPTSPTHIYTLSLHDALPILKPGMFYLEPVDYEETLDYAPEDDPMYGVDVLTSDVTLNTAYPCKPIPYRIHWLPQPYRTKHGLKAMIWSREEGPPVRIDIDPSTLEEYFDEVIAKASDAFGGQENY